MSLIKYPTHQVLLIQLAQIFQKSPKNKNQKNHYNQCNPESDNLRALVQEILVQQGSSRCAGEGAENRNPCVAPVAVAFAGNRQEEVH